MASKFTIVQVGKTETKYQFYINQLTLVVPPSGGTYVFNDDLYQPLGLLGRFNIVSTKDQANIEFRVDADSASWIQTSNENPMTLTVSQNTNQTNRLGMVKIIQNESNDEILLYLQQGLPTAEADANFIVVGSGGLISKVKI